MKKFLVYIATLSLALFTSCEGDMYSEQERATAQFKAEIDGEIDKTHYWKSCVLLDINVITDEPVTIYAYNEVDKETVMYDIAKLEASGHALLTVPQGGGNSFILTWCTEDEMQTWQVWHTGESTMYMSVNTTNIKGATSMKSKSAQMVPVDPSRNSLFGHSILPHLGYHEFVVANWRYATQVALSTEDPFLAGKTCNYELISNGPFYITMMAGYAGTSEDRILGYYYHSEGTYSDIVFVDITETHKQDYIAVPGSNDYMAKVQYQLDGVDQWYDANFDYRDGFKPPYTSNSARRGDNAYNTLLVNDEYGARITKVRGLAFPIDAPAGKMVGFYLRMTESSSPEQRQRLIEMGVPESKLPIDFKETNFTTTSMNIDGLHRSMIELNGNMAYMGLEDMGTEGDYDCNDVMYAVETDPGRDIPEIYIPPVIIDVQYDRVQSWTVAYEDISRERDFDFDNCVLRLEPDLENEKLDIVLCNAAFKDLAYLKYDGPNGLEELGELSELWNSFNKSVTVTGREVYVGQVDWPLSYTIAKDVDRLEIHMKRGDCVDCRTVITTAKIPGHTPEGLVVPGVWRWPKEDVEVYYAYPQFPKWAKEYSKQAFWDWYSYPQSNLIVSK